MAEATEAETIYLRGAGVVWTFTAPLSAEIEKQLVRQELVRVNEDGTPWVEPETGEVPEVKRPAKSALKAEWVGYAVSQGMSVDDADAATRDDLIERFGKD
jgi:hypothetical protein